jgi:outer membrane protein
MRRIRILLALMGLSVGALAQTNTPEVRTLSLEDCLAIAIEHNLDVQIKRYDPEISRFNLWALQGAYDSSLYLSAQHDDNQQPGGLDSQGRPVPGLKIETDSYSGGLQGLLPWGLSYNLGMNLADQTSSRPGTVNTTTTFFTNTFLDLTTGNSVTFVGTNLPSSIPASSQEIFSGSAGFLQLRQPLLKNFWIDNNRLQIYLDRKKLKISELDLRAQVITTVTDVETAYYNLLFAQESVKVQQKALELANRLVTENKKRVEVGALAPLDEKQAESQAAASRADLLAAMGTEDTQERVLKSLLSDDYSKWKNVSIQPTEAMIALPEQFNLQESWEHGLRLRPDLQQQQLRLEQQGYVLRFQKNQLFPQLDLVGTAGYKASSSSFTGYLDQFGGGDNPFWSIGGQMSIPLGNHSARNNYRAAKVTKDQIALQLKQLEQNILIQIENAIATARTSFQRVDATREARIYAEAALDAEQKKLESGKSTSFEVLRLQRDLTSARSAEIRALADYNIALAQIALNEGTTLDRRHVRLEVK